MLHVVRCYSTRTLYVGTSSEVHDVCTCTSSDEHRTITASNAMLYSCRTHGCGHQEDRVSIRYRDTFGARRPPSSRALPSDPLAVFHEKDSSHVSTKLCGRYGIAAVLSTPNSARKAVVSAAVNCEHPNGREIPRVRVKKFQDMAEPLVAARSRVSSSSPACARAPGPAVFNAMPAGRLSEMPRGCKASFLLQHRQAY